VARLKVCSCRATSTTSRVRHSHVGRGYRNTAFARHSLGDSDLSSDYDVFFCTSLACEDWPTAVARPTVFAPFGLFARSYNANTGACLRKRDPNEKKRKPEALANVVGAFLKESKLDLRVEQASVVPEWEMLVGKQIATVTKPISVTPDGTLFVAVKTNAWMTELSLMEPQILRALNAKAGRQRVRKIRLQLMR
jgi:hypothetical protein